MNSSQIVYSEHHYDECFEYKQDKRNEVLKLSGRVPDGTAIGYLVMGPSEKEELVLFNDITYSQYDHDYWDNYELEFDTDRVII